MFRTRYEQHGAPSQTWVASGLRAGTLALVPTVPQGVDISTRLENGWRGLEDVKEFKKELEARIKRFIMKIDKSKSKEYIDSVPGASEPWKGEILFPRIKSDGTPRDPIAIFNAQILQNVECNNARVPIATIPAGSTRHSITVERQNGKPDEWHFRRGWLNEDGGFSFTLWTLYYAGNEGERFFDVMFAERQNDAIPPIYGVPQARPSPAPVRSLPARDAPPGYSPPQLPRAPSGEPPAYSPPRPSHDPTLGTVAHRRRRSSHLETEAEPGPPSRRASSPAPRDTWNSHDSSAPAGESSSEQTVDERVAGVGHRGDFTAIPPAFGDCGQDMHFQVGEWHEEEWDLLETRIRAFLAFYTVRVARYNWTFRGKSSRDQDVSFTKKVIHGQEPDMVHVVEITVNLQGVWTPIKPEKREATRTIPAFYDNSVMFAFVLPGATIASDRRQEGDEPAHSSHPRVVIPVHNYAGSKKWLRRQLQHASDDIWDFSSRIGPLLPGSEMPHLALHTTWTVRSANPSLRSPTIVVHFAKDNTHTPLARDLTHSWTTFSLSPRVFKSRDRRREWEGRAFE
ncbi:hypothetical protein Rt10032_c18g6084 [Rhodotorula toruloides]|uniref:Uncharacterized protein n=1 Tax=Rhodotorula toruloides TaxID=5286 RepID=A0A511KNW9_RHOTO|nr:hypothetical protein Rt10032_c18g6084 [Rhodotorula toruloides]